MILNISCKYSLQQMNLSENVFVFEQIKPYVTLHKFYFQLFVNFQKYCLKFKITHI